MTVIRPNSISGITSLTAHRGSIDFYAHDGSAATFTNINSNVTSGVSTFASLNITGDLDVGGALTYEDVTNVDSIGVVTARNGIDVTGGTVTITTGANSASPAGSGDNLVIKDSNGCGLSILSGNGNSQNIYLGSVSDNDAVRLEGFYNSGSPYFNIYTGGSQRLRIKSDGDVYIGNIAHSNDGGANSSYRTLTLTDTTNGAQLHLRGQSPKLFLDVTSGGNGEIYYDTGDLRILSGEPGTTSSEKLRITSGGLIGVNVTPTQQKLTIDVDSSGTTAASFDGINICNTNSTTNNGAAIVFGQAIAGNSYARIGVINSDRTGSSEDQDIFFGTLGGGSYAERLRIKSDGKLMTQSAGYIYTTSSAGSLSLYGGNTNLGGGIVLSGGNANGDIRFYAEMSTSNPTERLRIKSDGKIGINASSGWNAYGDVLLVQADTGATGKSMISVRGGSTGYVHSALKLSATTHSNSSGNQRGLGVFMHDESSSVEWYAGRPYAQSDYFLIARKTAVNAANAGGVTAQHSQKKWLLDSVGRTTQSGGIYTYQPGQGGGAKSSRAIEAKGASGTYSSCVVDVAQHSYGSVAWDIKVGGYSSRHMHVAGTYYCNGGLYANYTSINNSNNVTYTRAFTSNQTIRHTFGGSFVHPICEVTATVGGDGYFDPGDITITWS